MGLWERANFDPAYLQNRLNILMKLETWNYPSTLVKVRGLKLLSPQLGFYPTHLSVWPFHITAR